MSLFNYSTTTCENLFATLFSVFSIMQMYFVFSREMVFSFALATTKYNSRNAVYNMRNQRHKFQAERERFSFRLMNLRSINRRCGKARKTEVGNLAKQNGAWIAFLASMYCLFLLSTWYRKRRLCSHPPEGWRSQKSNNLISKFIPPNCSRSETPSWLLGAALASYWFLLLTQA